MTEELRKFYVYAYLDPRKPGKYCYHQICFEFEPFYIGKGFYEDRKYKHLRWAKEWRDGPCRSYKLNKIRSILKCGLEPVIQVVTADLIEEKAFELEIELITSIGRADLNTGPLTNLTDGGEGSRRMKHREDVKEKYELVTAD